MQSISFNYSNAEIYDPRKILGPTRMAMTKKIFEKIQMLGSKDRDWKMNLF